MAKIRIQLDGNFDDTVKAFADEHIKNEVLPRITADAKRIVPVDTGELQESIHPESSAEGHFVVADADHALFVEQGTSKMQAQPYLRPALKNKR